VSFRQSQLVQPIGSNLFYQESHPKLETLDKILKSHLLKKDITYDYTPESKCMVKEKAQ
jgi:hypothetical protein